MAATTRTTAGTERTRDLDAGHWPAGLRVPPRTLLAVIVVWLLVAWAVFLAVDIANVAGLGDALHLPMWWHLFNDRPVEWTQWLVLAVAILFAGYVAGRLGHTDHRGAAMFFLVLGAGLGMMLFEDAGDARHRIGLYVRDAFGTRIFGLPFQLFYELPYFAVIAALPIFAVLRYGRYVWHLPSVRHFLVAAAGLYGIAATGSALRHFRYFYVTVGSRIDAWFLGGRLPLHPSFDQDRAHFFLMDGPFEESIELLAATCMLCMILAYARELRRGRVAGAPRAAPGV